jgi:hypothetical protein
MFLKTHGKNPPANVANIWRIDDKSAETIPMLSDTSDDQVDKFIDLIVYDNQARVTIVWQGREMHIENEF